MEKEALIEFQEEENPKVICECGISICKRSLPAHRKSKTHERFLRLKEEKEDNEESDSDNEIEESQISTEI